MRLLKKQAFGVCFIHDTMYHDGKWYHYESGFEDLLDQFLVSTNVLIADITCPSCQEENLDNATA